MAMTQERWKKAEALFHEALERPESERRAWLEAACEDDRELAQEVLSLLGSDAEIQSGFLEKRIEPAIESVLKENAESVLPERAGPYKIVRELGRGGMGTVYLAERDDEQYQSQVAVKLVRRGMDTDLILHRFYRERQTLARLQHPNIARLLDGGNTKEGHPYIVMEYVEGLRITEYCQKNGLGVTQRLRLFLDVCKAVAYAHRQFVVHRDIKPGNILVDQTGAVKLLDFGICKLLHAEEASGERTMGGAGQLMSPDYASPEQIRGETITVASDVYSAAAVLYELLTDMRPHKIEDYSLRGIEKGICDEEIVPPSKWKKQLAGDLDNIILCGLEKEAARRYQSMEQFAEDIRRYLEYEPVRARPSTLTYRVGKFMRRRKGLVLSAAIIVLTLAGAAIISWRQARIANENLAMVRKLSNAFVFDVYDAVYPLPGATKARELIVATGLQYLDNLAKNSQADIEQRVELASAYHRIGDVQGDVMNANLGQTGEALKSYGKALKLLDGILESEPAHRTAGLERVMVHRRIGAIHEYTRDMKTALATYKTAQQLAHEVHRLHPKDTMVQSRLAGTYLAASTMLRREGDYQQARDGFMKALDYLQPLERADLKHWDNGPEWELQGNLATAYAGVGLCDVRLGRLGEALAMYRKALQMREVALAAEPTSTKKQRDLMFVLSHIGDALGNPNVPNLGDTKGAMEAYRRMVDVARKIQEADQNDQRARSDYAIAIMRLTALMGQDAAPEKVRMLRQAIAMQEEVSRIDPKNTSNLADLTYTYNFLGDALQEAKQNREAVEAYKQGLRCGEPILEKGSSTLESAVGLLYRKLGVLSAKNSERALALAYAKKAYDLSDPEGPKAKGRPEGFQRFFTLRGFAAMGLVYAALGEKKMARNWLEQSISRYRGLEKHPSYSSTYKKERAMLEKTLEELQ
jgi:tetratricopeptide (TPR) repeat protein